MAAIIDRPDLQPEVTEPTAIGDRFVGGAALTATALLVTVQVLAGEIIPPLAVFAAVYSGLGLALVRRRSRWALIAVTVIALVHLLGSVPFFVASLSHPESPASFLSETFVALAVLVTLTGAIAGLRSARPGSRRPLAIGAVALATVAVVTSLVSASAATSDVRQDGDVPVVAERVAFPDQVEVPAGGTLWLQNQDPIHHTFVIEGTDVHQDLAASTAVRTPIDLAPGSYRFFCDVPGHERMAGDLVAF